MVAQAESCCSFSADSMIVVQDYIAKRVAKSPGALCVFVFCNKLSPPSPTKQRCFFGEVHVVIETFYVLNNVSCLMSKIHCSRGGGSACKVQG